MDKLAKIDHFVSIETLDLPVIQTLIARAKAFKKGESKRFSKPLYAVNLFFEASTRTHTSFQMAEKKLGLKTIHFDIQGSSINKGETLYDTLLTMSAIGINIAVIRHSDNKYYQNLLDQENINLAIINAGDGSGQHPSQCLLDLMTISEEFSSFKDLKVAIVGDLTHSRVAHSNMKVLQRLGAKVYFSGPEQWFSKTYEQYGEYVPMDDLVEEVDVLMMLRIQNERHIGGVQYGKDEYLNQFGLTSEREKRMKPKAIIMHPAPVNRDVEIADALVECERSRIIQQMRNGVFARMAILEAVAQQFQEKEMKE